MTNSWVLAIQPKEPRKRHKRLIKGDKTKGLILSEDSGGSATGLGGNVSLPANFDCILLPTAKCSF